MVVGPQVLADGKTRESEGGQKCSSSGTNEEFNIFLALGWHNR